MKHHFWDNPDEMSEWRPIKGRSILQNIQLPKLKHLAVSVPGTAFDLIRCIAAPMLEDLDLDASRGPTYGDWPESPEIDWDHWVLESVYNTLKLFALRCRNVRRLGVFVAKFVGIVAVWREWSTTVSKAGVHYRVTQHGYLFTCHLQIKENLDRSGSPTPSKQCRRFGRRRSRMMSSIAGVVFSL